MAKILDKFFNRKIEGKLVAESGDELPKELPSVSSVDNGKVLLVSGGKWQAGSVSGGTQLYKHLIHAETEDDDDIYFEIINNDSEELNTKEKVMTSLRLNLIGSTSYRHNVVIGYFNTSPIYISANDAETNLIRGSAITSMVVTTYPAINFSDTVTPL